MYKTNKVLLKIDVYTTLVYFKQIYTYFNMSLMIFYY